MNESQNHNVGWDFGVTADHVAILHGELNAAGRTLQAAMTPFASTMRAASASIRDFSLKVTREWMRGVPYTDRRRARRAARWTGMRFTVDRSRRPHVYRFQ